MSQTKELVFALEFFPIFNIKFVDSTKLAIKAFFHLILILFNLDERYVEIDILNRWYYRLIIEARLIDQNGYYIIVIIKN